jgi:hypothetical protein
MSPTTVDCPRSSKTSNNTTNPKLHGKQSTSQSPTRQTRGHTPQNRHPPPQSTCKCQRPQPPPPLTTRGRQHSLSSSQLNSASCNLAKDTASSTLRTPTRGKQRPRPQQPPNKLSPLLPAPPGRTTPPLPLLSSTKLMAPSGKTPTPPGPTNPNSPLSPSTSPPTRPDNSPPPALSSGPPLPLRTTGSRPCSPPRKDGSRLCLRQRLNRRAL